MKCFVYMNDVVLVDKSLEDVRRGNLCLRLFWSVSGMNVNWATVSIKFVVWVFGCCGGD